VWSRKFEKPVLLPDGRKIVSLRDAAHYIMDLPAGTIRRLDWQLAM
jgi:hypothetical protein